VPVRRHPRHQRRRILRVVARRCRQNTRFPDSRMMLIRVPLQSVAAVAAAAGVPTSPSHRMIAYIDSDAVDKTSPVSSYKVSDKASVKNILVCTLLGAKYVCRARGDNDNTLFTYLIFPLLLLPRFRALPDRRYTKLLCEKLHASRKHTVSE